MALSRIVRRGGIAAVCLLAVGVGLTLLMGGSCKGAADPAAEKVFMSKLGHTSVTVFPTGVRESKDFRYNAAAADALADFLTEQKLATVTRSDHDVPITSKWGINEAKMFKGSAKDLADYVKAHPISTDYAMMAEYLMGGNGKAVGVHVYVVTKDGVIAYGSLWNSHQKAFSSVDPKTVEDCTKVLLKGLPVDLVKPTG